MSYIKCISYTIIVIKYEVNFMSGGCFYLMSIYWLATLRYKYIIKNNRLDKLFVDIFMLKMMDIAFRPG